MSGIERVRPREPLHSRGDRAYAWVKLRGGPRSVSDRGFEMRSRYVVAGVAVAVWTGIWALPAASAGGESGATDDESGQVIRVVSREVDSADLDLGKQGFTLGDRFVFTDNLFMHGKRVGSDHGECLVTRIHGESGSFECNVTAVFRGRGQITVQGAATFSEEEGSPVVLAVTGGTREFRDSGGQVRVDESAGDSTLLTFHLEE
jgi:hypothetical protein